jgi:hypothetical protein
MEVLPLEVTVQVFLGTPNSLSNNNFHQELFQIISVFKVERNNYIFQ